MQLVLTAESAALLDATASDPVEVLMERAGLGLAIEAVRMGAVYGRRVVVLAGPGNNGGDGYVAARHLRRRGVAVTVVALAPPRADAAAEAAEAARRSGVPVLPWHGPDGPVDLLVDALFGGGFRGELPEKVDPWLEVEAPVLAVDVPSGVRASTGEVAGRAFRAARTVTFHARKVGHLVGAGAERCGRVVVVDIGLEGGEPELLLCEEVDAPRPLRRRRAHKWSAGAVMVVGGAPGMTGAPLLAARAALHGGAGAVTLACPAALADSYAGVAPEILVRPIGSGTELSAEHARLLVERAGRFDVMAVGPGLGDGVGGFVRTLLERWSGTLVLDADGINALDGAEVLRARSAPTVLTPHAGEFRRLTAEHADHHAAAGLARRTGVVVVLKGSPTFVCSGDESWVVTSGGPELATIGTGDVLTGLLSALVARGLDPPAAARSAVYWHGVAGRSLALQRTVTADRLATEVGRWSW